MLAAVQLDDDPRLIAIEVDDIRRNRVLAAEFMADEAAVAQHQPEARLGVGLGRTQPPREAQDILWQL